MIGLDEGSPADWLWLQNPLGDFDGADTEHAKCDWLNLNSVVCTAALARTHCRKHGACRTRCWLLPSECTAGSCIDLLERAQPNTRFDSKLAAR